MYTTNYKNLVKKVNEKLIKGILKRIKSWVYLK